MALLGITSATAIEIQIDPSYRDRDRPLQKPFSRSADGTARQAREPIYKEWSFKVGWLPATDGAVANSWWASGAPLLFWEDQVTFPNSAWPVRIANPTKPPRQAD